MIVAFALGAGFPAILKWAKTWGKVAILAVDPGTNNIELFWKKRTATGLTLGADKTAAQSPLDSTFLHEFDGKRAYIINKRTGSPMKATNEGAWKGLDGRAWFKAIWDERVAQVQRSGAQNLESLMRWAIIGLGIVIVGMVIIGGMVAAAR